MKPQAGITSACYERPARDQWRVQMFPENTARDQIEPQEEDGTEVTQVALK